METTRKDIQFLLNDRLISIDFQEHPGLKPTTTVLNYLRALPGFKGVKEGCAEGDCGACTVVTAEIAEGRLVYKTIDSCLVFLPMLHGKQVLTVEHLADGNSLHPVQQAMLEHNGSQCGYCTPGVVMSLFGLYKNSHNPSRPVINDALTGNLCRCTGYRPIADAAADCCSGNGKDQFTSAEQMTLEILGKIQSDRRQIEITTDRQLYLKPMTLSDALSARLRVPEAVIISGSTDVALRQTKKKELLTTLLDLSSIEELCSIIADEHQYWIGAGVTIEQLRKFSHDHLPALAQMLSVFGSLQIRNLATIGGNVGSASPIGDVLPLLFACRASLRLQSASVERTIAISDFITGYRTTCLNSDELITGIILPRPADDVFIRSYKVSKRKDLDISTVSAGFMLKLSQGRVADLVLAFGGMAATTACASETEAFLRGKPWDEPTVAKAMEILENEFRPLSDARAGATYRTLVSKNLLMKFYVESTAQEV